MFTAQAISMAVDALGSGAGRASGASMDSSEEQDTGIPPTQKKKLWALTKQAGSKTIQMAKDMKKIASSGAGMLGINFSLGAILKQSQIFTGIMGSLFQILGAVVDVFMAPLIPFFIPLMQKMATTLIPWAQRKGEQFATWIQQMLDTSDGPIAFLGNLLKEGLMNTARWIWQSISQSNFISKAVWNNETAPIVNLLRTTLKLVGAYIAGQMAGGLVGSTIGSAFGPAGAALGAKIGTNVGGKLFAGVAGAAMLQGRFSGGETPVSVEVKGPDNQQLRVNQYKSADRQRVIIESEGTDFTGEIQ